MVTQYKQAHLIWEKLVPWVDDREIDEKITKGKRRPGLITYGRLAVKLGYRPQAGRTLSKPLGIIANLCKREGLPMLNAVVVNKQTGKPGENIWINHCTAEAEIEATRRHVWRSYKAPTPRQFRTAWEDWSRQRAGLARL